MSWNTPANFSVNELVSANKLNIMVDDLIYLKHQTDALYMQGGFTTGIQTILPAGSVTKSVYIIFAAFDETSNTFFASPTTSSNTAIPGGGDSQIQDAGATKRILIHYNANGSVTAERTIGSFTWGLRALLLYY